MISENKSWWKEAIVYQIYPRSFQDSNGDGIGDLRGIIQRLDYIQSLDIDVIWLNPIYRSPNRDNGYDISDYFEIMEDFGTMADFDELLKGVHQRGMKLIMDLVVNHTSDQHRWFQESKSSRTNRYRNYYHWWPAEKGIPPRRWSYFEQDAWTYESETDSYYLHYFSKQQPDLNWENESVRREIFEMMHFWFKKGIDGFRMDVITFISKHLNYPEFPDEFQGSEMIHKYADGPNLHKFLHEMNTKVLQKYDVVTIAEGPGTSPGNVLNLVDEDRKELNMSYHFDHQNIGINSKFILQDDFQDLVKFKKVFIEWENALANKGWQAVYLGNHDFARMVTRFGNDSNEWRSYSSKMLTTFILSMRGTPLYYMGDELGMCNIKFSDINDYRDVMTLNLYEMTKREGADTKELLDSHKITARDNARTPFQWDDSENAGFSCVKPWIKVNPNYKEVNLSHQEDDLNSEIAYFRRMVSVRKSNPVFTYGSFTILFAEHKDIFCFLRSLDELTVLIVLNFSALVQELKLPDKYAIGEVIINNYDKVLLEQEALSLLPYQSLVTFVLTQHFEKQ